ncbi:MAG TPA: heavy-metal-associated domain-containing protein [Steroidobacteraceae bacterium]|nr:heavy-metal-associated domain-containing protein [Steroidobacteraceae bacterium]
MSLMIAFAANATTIEMKVYGMVCGFCAQGIEKILKKNPATQDVVVDLEKKLVVVTTREGKDISDAELTKAIGDAGYDVKQIARTERSLDDIRSENLRAAK